MSSTGRRGGEVGNHSAVRRELFDKRSPHTLTNILKLEEKTAESMCLLRIYLKQNLVHLVARMIYWVSTILTCRSDFCDFVGFLIFNVFFFYSSRSRLPVFLSVYSSSIVTHSSAGKAVLALNKGLQRSVSISCKPFTFI